MVSLIPRVAGALVLGVSTGLVASDESAHVAVPAAEVRWGPASPKLPPGAQMAVIAGDPAIPGAPYVFRAKLPDGYSVPPHWHPMDENVTVLQGVFKLGFGARMQGDGMQRLEAGSFTRLPKEMPHYNRMEGETILQFHGIGPYDIVYVDSAAEPARGRTGN